MKKVKLYVVSAALLLLTVGVFAGRAKFVPQDVYVDRGGGVYTKLVTNTTFNDLSTNQPIGYTQARITSSFSGVTYPLVTDNSGTKQALYTQSNQY